MPIINTYIIGRQTTHVVGRTTQDFVVLVNTIKETPGEWFVYSTHLNMGSAHNRASRLRGPETPAVLVEHKPHLEFKALRHTEHGPCVLVRWCQP